MSMTELNLLLGQIDKVFGDLVDLDVRIAQRTGNVSIGMSTLRDLKDELSNNARKALLAPKVSDLDLAIHKAVVEENCSIQDVADRFGVGRSKVRAAMDRVTDMNRSLAHQL